MYIFLFQVIQNINNYTLNLIHLNLDENSTPTGNILALNDLPNKFILLVLDHLDLEDKKNFKLASKSCEKTVLSLDPVMRRWKVYFRRPVLVKSTLSKAKMKHGEKDYFTKIEISVHMTKAIFDLDLCFLTESVIHQWKNNIVHLRLSLNHINFFILEQSLGLPHLESLDVHDSEDSLKGKGFDEFKKRNEFILSSLVECYKINHIELNIASTIKITPLRNDTASTDLVCEVVKGRSLLDLPNDELKLVLEYLNLQEKKNMKLVSKMSEQRVLTLNLAMRKWRIQFNNDNYEDQKKVVSRAKIRHADEPYFEKISVCLDFTKIDFGNKYSRNYNFVLLTENVISQWKTNIVYLGIKISGEEDIFYLLDSDLQLPRLTSLQMKCDSMTRDNSVRLEKANFVPDFVDKFKTTLEKLDARDIAISSLTGLRLKEFCCGSLRADQLSSLLRTLPSTLETLQINHIIYFYGIFNMDPNIKLSYKKLIVDDVPIRIVESVLRASQVMVI